MLPQNTEIKDQTMLDGNRQKRFNKWVLDRENTTKTWEKTNIYNYYLWQFSWNKIKSHVSPVTSTKGRQNLKYIQGEKI